MTTKIKSSNIADGSIHYTHCDWYSPDTSTDVGALKLPRGNTSERPTVNTGGRENVTFDLTVSQPDILETDPNFPVNDPWLWSWESNYNRSNPATNVNGMGSEVQALELFKGSTYNFRNFTIGHKLWLRHTAKADPADAENVNLVTGATNNGAIRTQGSADPGVVTWTIPDDYAYSSVFIQHSQTGMVNEVTVSDPPTETLGYIRLNTDVGHDPTTKTGLEIYTGTGWKTVPFEDNVQAVQTHPTGTITRLDMGVLTDSVTANIDDGAITGSNDTTRDGLGLVLSAFLEAGKLSVNNNAIVVHDGSTGGGFPMLKDDMSNVTDSLVNKRFGKYTTSGETILYTNNAGTSQRLSLTQVYGILGLEVENGISIRCTKDVTNTLFKIDFNLLTSADCQLRLYKNGSQVSNITMKANYHNQFTDIIPLSFNDLIDFRVYRSDGASVDINNLDRLTVEFIGSN